MIKYSEYIDINGSKQFISIRSDAIGLPLLLYLHGGPGDAALPLVNKYNKSLESMFTVVVWEQRGAGKSYYNFGSEKITINTFIKDAIVLINELLKRYKQEKVYLVGHSWGSVLGIKLLQVCPDLIKVYVGCGQVTNMKKSCQAAYQYTLEQTKIVGDSKTRNRLNRIDCAYVSENWMNDLLFVTRQVVKYKGSLYGKKNYNGMIKDIILSSEYNIKDLINRQKGSYQSIKYLWQELMTVDFEELTQFQVPIVFVEGRYDYHVSSPLVYDYYNSIQSSKQFHWFDQSCHFPQWSQAQKFEQVMREIVMETAPFE